MVKTIADEILEAHSQVRALIGRAETEQRELSEAEEREVAALEAKVQALATKRAKQAHATDVLARITAAALPSAQARGALLFNGGGEESLGVQLTKHAAFEQFRSALGGDTPIAMTPIELRAAASTPYLPPAGGFPPTTLAPPPHAPLPAWGGRTIASLLPVIGAEAGQAIYLQDPMDATGADLVPPGTDKPGTTVAPVLKQEALVKIAHTSAVAQESLEDLSGFASYMDSVMVTGVLDRESLYLATTLAAAAPAITSTAGIAGIADKLLDAAVQVQVASKKLVDAILVSADIFLALATSKASTGGQYLSGLPLSVAPALALWGIPLVVSADLAAQSAIVGAFNRSCMLFKKSGVRVDASNSHADFFVKNLVMLRAETRELLAVRVPKGLGKLTALVP